MIPLHSTTAYQPTVEHVCYVEQKISIHDKTDLLWNPAAQQPTPTLKAILKATGIHQEELTLKRLVEITQKRWLRTGERAQVQDSTTQTELWDQLQPHFVTLGLINTVLPRCKTFSSALVMGAKLNCVKTRLEYLLKEILKGEVSVDKIYLFSGERSLDDDEIEQMHKMGFEVTDEREMMEIIGTQMLKEYHKQRPTSPVLPMEMIKATKQEGKRRATTADTVIAWMAQHNIPSPSHHLIVSTQPYGIYQWLVAEVIREQTKNEEVSFDIIAPETGEKRVAIFLDTLARILYMIQKRLN